MKASELLSLDPLFLDTETTGMDENDQVIEIALVDVDGKAVFHRFIQPTVPVKASATRVHGITNEMLADALPWHAVYVELSELMKGRVICAFNAAFDERLIDQTSIAYFLPSMECEFVCAREISGENVPLKEIVSRFGFLFTEHTAIGDAAATLAMIKNLSEKEMPKGLGVRCL